MIKLITLAVIASLHIFTTTARPGWSDMFKNKKGSPRLDTARQQVNCDGTIYGPRDFENAQEKFIDSGGKNGYSKKAKYPKNHYTDRGEKYYYYPIGIEVYNGRDYAVLSSTYNDVVDVVIRLPKRSDKQCVRSFIQSPVESRPVNNEEARPVAAQSTHDSPVAPQSSGGSEGWGYEYTPYSQFHEGGSQPQYHEESFQYSDNGGYEYLSQGGNYCQNGRCGYNFKKK